MWKKYYASLYPTRKPADFAQYSAALHENLKEQGRLESLQHMLRVSFTSMSELTKFAKYGVPYFAIIFHISS